VRINRATTTENSPLFYTLKIRAPRFEPSQQTLPPQLTPSRLPRVTWKLLLSAAVFPPWHGS